MEIHMNETLYIVEVLDYSPERPTPMCSDHDSPAFSDPGDPERIEFRIVSSEPDYEEWVDPEPDPDFDPYSDPDFVNEVIEQYLVEEGE